MNDRDVINDILADDWLDIPIFLRDKVNARADRLLARAEAADARAEQFRRDYNDLYDDYHEMRHRLADIGAMLRAARQRVAELEAQIAAQGWRPVTEDWPPYNERVIIGHGGGYGGGWSAFARRVRTDDRDGDDWLMDDDTTLAFESAVVAMPRPLPPAPQETTP